MAELDRNGVIYIREHPTAYDIKHIGEKIGQLTAISPVIILNKEIMPRKNERENIGCSYAHAGKKYVVRCVQQSVEWQKTVVAQGMRKPMLGISGRNSDG